MKYVYGARKLNETNADDRSNTIMRARSSSLDTTVSRSIIDSTLFSPSLFFLSSLLSTCRYIACQVTTPPPLDSQGKQGRRRVAARK